MILSSQEIKCPFIDLTFYRKGLINEGFKGKFEVVQRIRKGKFHFTGCFCEELFEYFDSSEHWGLIEMQDEVEEITAIYLRTNRFMTGVEVSSTREHNIYFLKEERINSDSIVNEVIIVRD
ncbi:hypothetical protein H6G33_09495 [Calothrix sp. FACHB-1219]|uniref:hypothetical protein n=1 Tax=unclassified Calothrix TaxID=2619626 RepID=UPI0016873A11|nr:MULTISPECIES: hypothetical protein [unclassified Calothrix]MBD2201580.1 hypothetical protein [Calothrix sp. FACHB-168]MBD2217266.1 hypothetical protein [Calothrix sp. FACHB-1219]